MQFDREKFKRLVHYVIWKAGRRDGFGATKLNKVLWFAEARVYALRGRPIAGATYVREKHGPVPKQMMPIRAELEAEGKIRVGVDKHYDKPMTWFEAKAPPSMDGFDTEEIQAIDWWIKHIDEDHTATSISELSHDHAWEIAKMGEVIPFHAFLATRIREPNEEELEWARAKVPKPELF